MPEEKERNFTVTICEDYVIRDPDKVKEILERVSKKMTNTYMNKKEKRK